MLLKTYNYENASDCSLVDITLVTLTDAQLIELYISGDEDAFRELIARYKNSLYNFLSRYLNRQDMVEDVFQDTFLQLIHSRNSFDTKRPLHPWLFTIAANKARDAIRKLQKTHEIPIGTIEAASRISFNEVLDAIAHDDSSQTSELERSENAVLVHEVISTMPVTLREILILAYFNGFTYRQISKILNIPIGTVKSRLHSAVGHFAKLWKSLPEDIVY
jgi:RNA polymerase sigma-70 factor, ECF subfamily